jgi:hypothetical protein
LHGYDFCLDAAYTGGWRKKRPEVIGKIIGKLVALPDCERYDNAS